MLSDYLKNALLSLPFKETVKVRRITSVSVNDDGDETLTYDDTNGVDTSCFIKVVDGTEDPPIQANIGDMIIVFPDDYDINRLTEVYYDDVWWNITDITRLNTNPIIGYYCKAVRKIK